MRIRNILPERAVKGGNPQMMRRAANRLSKLNDAVVTKVKRYGEPYAGKLHVRFDEGAGVPHGASRSTLHPNGGVGVVG